MGKQSQIILVDGDVRRRAAISHCLAACGTHVEPFENIEELILRWPRSGLIMAHDGKANIGELMQHMGDCGRWLPVIAFAEAPMPARIVRAVLNGAIGYVSWPFAEDELASCLDETEERAGSVGSAKLREARARSRIDRLTRREREVLSGVASGLSNRMIGEKLAISPRTVEIHRANMLTKIGASHTSDAIRIAIEASLVH